MWNGAFVPTFRKSADASFAGGGEHRQPNPLITIGEFVAPDVVEVFVQFNHKCKWPGQGWTEPPSNEIKYRYLYTLIFSDSRGGLQAKMNRLHEDEKSLRWLHDELESGRLETTADSLPETSGFSVESLI